MGRRPGAEELIVLVLMFIAALPVDIVDGSDTIKKLEVEGND